MQRFYHGPAVLLMEVQTLFGGHPLHPRYFVVPVDLAQTF
jgi:hypothetical protein